MFELWVLHKCTQTAFVSSRPTPSMTNRGWGGGGGGREHHRGIAPGVESVTKPRTATRATFTLAPSYHLPSSYGLSVCVVCVSVSVSAVSVAVCVSVSMSVSVTV